MTDLNLKDQAEQALQVLLEKTIQAGEFIASEVPLVIQELLMWEFTKSLLFFVAGVMIPLVAIYTGYKFIKWGLKDSDAERGYGGGYQSNFQKYDLEVAAPVTYTFGGFGVLISSALLINLTWLQIWLAPRVFLLEYASNLVK